MRTLPQYVERHITHFTTLRRLSPTYFNQSANATLPENILTAPKFDLEDTGIFSITVVTLVPPADAGDCIDELEYLYKIASSRPIPDAEIKRLVSHEMSHNEGVEVESSDNGVTWVHREVWPHAYPASEPGQPLLEDVKIAPDLFYIATGEDMFSSLETSCRMGLNVAKHLYYSKWVGEMYP